MIDYSKSLLKKYRFKLYTPFLKALKEFSLINDNDKIAICISGGKDSFIMALLFKELIKHSDHPFTMEFIMMNPGYSKENLDKILENAKKLDINLHIFNTKIFKISNDQEKNKCYICAKMRRGALYNEAKKLGCNKIALAHHMNDVNETLLMSILFSGEVGGMKPIVKSDNYEDMYLIRPMYYVKEKNIIDYARENELEFLKCGCFLTSDSILCESSKRQVIKKIINSLDDDNEYVSKNIMKAMSNVNLNKMNAYKIDDKIIDLVEKDA